MRDLFASPSGGGYISYCPEGIPVDFAFLSLLAAFGAAFGILYRALTLLTGRKRRKRQVDIENMSGEEVEEENSWIRNIMWHGK